MLREELLDTLENMLKSHSSHFRDTMAYVLDHKLDLFKEYNYKLYDGDDNILDLILPSITRLYGKYFISPPTILSGAKLELFQLSFNIDHFIDYFLEIISKVKKSLIFFENLNRTSETLTLIVDNYVSERFDYTYNCKDIEQEIRDIKINKIIKLK